MKIQDIKIGDVILIPKQDNKPRFDAKITYTVTKIKQNSILADTNWKQGWTEIPNASLVYYEFVLVYKEKYPEYFL